MIVCGETLKPPDEDSVEGPEVRARRLVMLSEDEDLASSSGEVPRGIPLDELDQGMKVAYAKKEEVYLDTLVSELKGLRNEYASADSPQDKGALFNAIKEALKGN